MDYIFEPILRLFANIPEIILINIFLIIASYTDIKTMKIYTQMKTTHTSSQKTEYYSIKKKLP